MKTVDILPGVKIYRDNNISLLFGCPPEVIKFLMIQQIDFPDYIVIPDTIYQNGILQNSTEFPLYYFLFILGNFFKGNKLNIVGNKKEITRNRELLRLTLLGPTKSEYDMIGKSKYYEGLYKESRELAIKNKDGIELTIDDFINFFYFEKDEVNLNNSTIKHIDRNVYKVNEAIIDLNFTEKQVPPYELNPNNVPLIPSKFGIDILGGGSGFTPKHSSSGMLLNYYSNYMLLDCVPYLDYSLSCRGVSKNQIKSFFLTHIHDDHCNMFPLIEYNNKIEFLGTKEIFWMALKKLSLATDHDFNEFYSYFDFVELTPYEENEFYGITIIPHYTVHSIPTIGATFRMKDCERDYSLVFIGDNKALPEIGELVRKNIVTDEKYNHILSLYNNRYNLILPDGGMGILHGNPKDSLNSKSDRIVFLHLENLPKEFDATFSMARSGKRYNIIETTERSYDQFLIKTMQILQDHFNGISHEWTTALMNNLTLVNYNTDDIIIKQGEKSKGIIYVILSGSCSIKYHNGEKLIDIAEKEAGDFIGEMAIVKQTDTRSASVIAKTPVTLGVIDERLFYLFLRDENRIDDMINMWKIRSELEIRYPFSCFSDFVNDKIAKVSERIEIKKDTEVVKQGDKEKDFYIIVKGVFQVIHNGVTVTTLKEGDFFGEFGIKSGNQRNATVKAQDDGVILKIDQANITKIVNTTPILHFIIHQVIKKREEDLNKLSLN